MSHSIHPAGQLRMKLEKQLLVLKEEKGQFLDQYFPLQGKERASMDQFLSRYTDEVQNLLQAGEEHSFDIVLIGAQITINYLDYGASDTYHIVFPDEADADDNRISFLSPAGHHPLLAKRNDTIVIHAPAGDMQVRIVDIVYS